MLVSFFADTEDTDYYSRCAIKLAARCNHLKIPHKIVEMPDKGHWLENCRQKPFFIEDMLNILKQPIVWLDADGMILEDTDVFDNLACDLACSSRYWRKDWNPDPLRFRVSPIFFNYTPTAIEFVKTWQKYTNEMRDFPDHHAFEKAFFSMRNSLSFQFLPKKYSYGPVITNKSACCIPSRSTTTRRVERLIKREMNENPAS
jgi:hypothetical protein